MSAYSSSQISSYLDYISFPPSLRSAARDIHFLRTLHLHQITTFPYENLSLHYNPSHLNSLDPQDLFQKFTSHGRGGYCMETAVFFKHILLGLGFKAYSAGARIRLRSEHGVPSGPFVGWVHCTNIVTLDDGSKYSCDVGFGGDGPTAPLPLIHNTPQHNFGTQEIRLIYDSFPDATAGPLFWIYQYRNSSNSDWNTYYAFPEMEFTEMDFAMMNYWTATSERSFQIVQVLIVAFDRGEDGKSVKGKYMLHNGKVKRNLGGKTELVVECSTEDERVQALQRYFGITLTEEQRKAIQGYRTELKGKA
ncbi:hypothetical protein MBLNU457_g0593t1 [Dothideomycetes sp. NU457]